MEGKTQIFDAKKKLLEELGWEENPFVKDLRTYDKDSFLKYYCPLDGEKLLNKLAFDAKAYMLMGPKGVGKTSAMYYAYYNLPQDEFEVVTFKHPPASLEELAFEINILPGNGTLGSVISAIGSALGLKKGKKVKRSEIVDALRKKQGKLVWFLDEAHLEPNPEMYMEFKYLLDDVPNLRLVVGALGRENFPDSLMHLIGEKNVLARKGFSKEEMTNIVEHRIKAVGGKGTHPFSKAALDEVLTEQNLLTPRYVFDELNSRLAKMASGELDVKTEASRLSADDPIVKAATGGAEVKITKGNADWWVLLSPSQQQIMELLLKDNSGFTLAEICTKSSLAENTAFNALYQLRGDDKRELERKKEVPFPLVEVQGRAVGGRKKNVYFAASKVRNLFTLS
ncbi:MAG: ATP-binding protein [Candidatus Micrarchaeota archaeon]